MLRMSLIYFHSWKSQNREEFELHFASTGLGIFNKGSRDHVSFGPFFFADIQYLDFLIGSARLSAKRCSRKINWNMGSLVHFQYYLDLNNQYEFTETVTVASLHKYINIFLCFQKLQGK